MAQLDPETSKDKERDKERKRERERGRVGEREKGRKRDCKIDYHPSELKTFLCPTSNLIFCQKKFHKLIISSELSNKLVIHLFLMINQSKKKKAFFRSKCYTDVGGRPFSFFNWVAPVTSITSTSWRGERMLPSQIRSKC